MKKKDTTRLEYSRKWEFFFMDCKEHATTR